MSSQTVSLFAALKEEAAVRNAAQMRGGQAVSAACAVCSLIALTRDTTLAASMLGMSLVVFAFFTAGRVSSGRVQRVIFTITPAFALSLPAAIVLVVAKMQNVETAFSSWVVPGLIAFLTTLSVLRLEPWRPIIYASASSLLYLAAYAFATWDLTLAQREANVTLLPSVQLIRVIFFIGSGVGLSLVARAMKDSLERAERKTRARVLFGKYRLGPPIATGGMATVVEATYCPEGGFERPVAIKRVHPHLAKKPRVVDLFRTEAELGARLAHPNIVAVLDFGRIEDTYFIAMEHVVGVDLRNLLHRLQLRGRCLPPALAAFIACEALAGLSFAHATARDRNGRLLRVVHRDLSPANVLLSVTGEVKVTDFGIAATLLDDAQHQTRRIVGSMAYLSPEQASQEAFDHRADLFAIAVLLYEMLTGAALFKRNTTAATLMAVLHDETPAMPVWLADPRAWDRFFHVALAKNAADRFANAKEMAAGIAAVSEIGTADDLATFLNVNEALEAPTGDGADAAELDESDTDVADRETFVYG